MYLKNLSNSLEQAVSNVPAQDVITFLLGHVVGLLEAVTLQQGLDPSLELHIEGGYRDITIHPTTQPKKKVH